jgi:hypothetical protein
MDMGSLTDVSQIYAASVFRADFGPTRTERKAAGTRGQRGHWTRISYRAALFSDCDCDLISILKAEAACTSETSTKLHHRHA